MVLQQGAALGVMSVVPVDQGIEGPASTSRACGLNLFGQDVPHVPHVNTACVAKRYAGRMAQFVTRLEDRLAEEVDAMVADGAVANRSEAVRLGLERLVDRHRRGQIGAEIAEGYRRQPQTDEELGGLDRATRALVAEEPW